MQYVFLYIIITFFSSFLTYALEEEGDFLWNDQEEYRHSSPYTDYVIPNEHKETFEPPFKRPKLDIQASSQSSSIIFPAPSSFQEPFKFYRPSLHADDEEKAVLSLGIEESNLTYKLTHTDIPLFTDLQEYSYSSFIPHTLYEYTKKENSKPIPESLHSLKKTPVSSPLQKQTSPAKKHKKNNLSQNFIYDFAK